MDDVNPTMTKQSKPFSGYHQRGVPAEDTEITHTDPETPLGEYMRRFWQPVCMSEQLTDIPHPIRIMGEDLVAFRDKSGQIGVMTRHCCHRGASLEYGIIQEKGIRCCYHAFQFDVDGMLIDAPGEPDNGAKLAETACQGAYPAFERDGLVFAYMGPPELKPEFPEFDSFEKYDDTRLVPFTNVFPCNWLQVLDNIGDQMHTYLLHQPELLFSGNVPYDLDVGYFTLAAFGTVPLMDYAEVRDGAAMAFIAGRRMDDDLVWFRINECILPNMTHHAYLFEDGKEHRLFHRVHMARWYVPFDDTHSMIIGWRMFGKGADPRQIGIESRCGWDDIDFLGGQVNDRSEREARRMPGDWEAIGSQRPIAVHALENAAASDLGVYIYRKLLRDAVRGRNTGGAPEKMHERANAGMPTHSYTQNNVLKLPRRGDKAEDEKMIKEIGKKLIAIATAADEHAGDARKTFVVGKLEELERQYA
jgi:tert-butyl alcohol monooxygenase / tert-amyl alcohol desaturase